MAVHFIPDEIVPLIHADLIKRYGGTLGIRDRGLLASALAQPKMTAQKKFLHRTIFNKASAYGFHVCRNHPFVDGNKRIAFVLMDVFLLKERVETRRLRRRGIRDNDNARLRKSHQNRPLCLAQGPLLKDLSSGWPLFLFKIASACRIANPDCSRYMTSSHGTSHSTHDPWWHFDTDGILQRDRGPTLPSLRNTAGSSRLLSTRASVRVRCSHSVSYLTLPWRGSQRFRLWRGAFHLRPVVDAHLFRHTVEFRVLV